MRKVYLGLVLFALTLSGCRMLCDCPTRTYHGTSQR